jgi:hypothetical protein
VLLANISQVDAAFLQKLCDDHCPESGTLDFKRGLPVSTDPGKQEFVKDVCAFANADGGYLVYGIAEVAGSADELSPITGELHDSAKRRLSQVLNGGPEPRVQGIQFHHVDVTGGYVLIVRIPSSFDGPHCFRVNNNSRRFVMRNGTSTSDLTYGQLRSAFDRTATLADKARRFIDMRLQMVIERKTPKQLVEGPILAAHFVPIAGLAGKHSVDLQPLYAGGFTRFMGNDWGGGSRTFNLDGLIVHPGGSARNGLPAYTHIFRTGAMEAVRIGGTTREGQDGVRSVIWSTSMTRFFRGVVSQFTDAAKEWGFAGPAVLSFAILHTTGYELGIGDIFRPFSESSSDRPHMILPEVWIDSLDNVEIDGVVRPMMDMLFQAFDVERCLDFDASTGAYAPRRLG